MWQKWLDHVWLQKCTKCCGSLGNFISFDPKSWLLSFTFSRSHQTTIKFEKKIPEYAVSLRKRSQDICPNVDLHVLPTSLFGWFKKFRWCVQWRHGMYLGHVWESWIWLPKKHQCLPFQGLLQQMLKDTVKSSINHHDPFNFASLFFFVCFALSGVFV